MSGSPWSVITAIRKLVETGGSSRNRGESRKAGENMKEMKETGNKDPEEEGTISQVHSSAELIQMENQFRRNKISKPMYIEYSNCAVLPVPVPKIRYQI